MGPVENLLQICFTKEEKNSPGPISLGGKGWRYPWATGPTGPPPPGMLGWEAVTNLLEASTGNLDGGNEGAGGEPRSLTSKRPGAPRELSFESKRPGVARGPSFGSNRPGVPLGAWLPLGVEGALHQPDEGGC